MFTTLSTALSALNANSIAVAAVGNDLANLNTTGYKKTQVAFENLMAETMGGTNGFSLGMGTARPQTITQYTQGTLQTGLGGLNAGIQGQGFFMVADGKGNTVYTRDGTFTTGSNGFLIDANGSRVQGWSAGANGVVNTNGATGDIAIPSGTLFPPVASTNVTLSMNLNSAAIAGTKTGVTSGTFSQPITVYDSLGTSHTLTATFTKNQVQVPLEPSGSGFAASPVQTGQTATFMVSTGSTPTAITITPANDGTSITAQTAALNTKLQPYGITASLDSSGALQFASANAFSISASTTADANDLAPTGASVVVENTSLNNTTFAASGPSELDITVGSTTVVVPNVGTAGGPVPADADAINAALKAAGVTGVTAVLDETGAAAGPPATYTNIQLQGTANFTATYGGAAVDAFSPAPTGAANQWNYAVTMSGSDLTSGTTATVTSGTLTFDPTSGQLLTPTATGGVITLKTGSETGGAGSLTNGAVMNDISWDLYDGEGNPLVTQVNQASAVSANSADGSAAAQLTQVTMGDGGQLMAQFSNGKSVAIAQLSIANIPNPNSMLSVGNNDFEASSQTAAPIIGTAGTGGRGNVVGGSLEQSTVDIATEFANLITLQNAYQANSRVITTENQILQQTVSLLQP
jgi:flagellar hook protein FlgE